jgi:hypothetical protein
MALSLRERCQKRLEGLKKTRQPYEEEYREIASLAQPAKSRWLSTDTNKNVRQRNKQAEQQPRDFRLPYIAGRNDQRPVVALKAVDALWLHDEELADAPDVRAWLDEVEKRMYGFLAATNFYAAVKSGYLELGMFGTEACVMVEHPTEGAVCHQLTAGEYWIGLGSALTPEALYRRCPLTVVQVMQRFERSKISPRIIAAYDRSNYDEVCDIYQGSRSTTISMKAMPGPRARNTARSIGMPITARKRRFRSVGSRSSRSGRRGGKRPAGMLTGRARATMPCRICGNCSFRPSARARRPTMLCGPRSSPRPRSS